MKGHPLASLSCWRAIGSPELNQSPTILKAFDGRNFKPYGILSSFAVELGGKTVSIDIEVIDEPLDHNLLLGRSWFYAMTAVASSIFRMIQFPHLGQIVTVDLLDFCTLDLRSDNTTNIPFVSGAKTSFESVGVGLLKDSSLMGAFPSSAPNIASINMISSTVHQSWEYFDPWVVPEPSTVESLGDAMPLSLPEEQYAAIQAYSDTSSCDESHLVPSDSLPDWLEPTPLSSDHILETFPMDEFVLEVMSLGERPWEDLHHRASFLTD